MKKSIILIIISLILSGCSHLDNKKKIVESLIAIIENSQSYDLCKEQDERKIYYYHNEKDRWKTIDLLVLPNADQKINSFNVSIMKENGNTTSLNFDTEMGSCCNEYESFNPEDPLPNLKSECITVNYEKCYQDGNKYFIDYKEVSELDEREFKYTALFIIEDHKVKQLEVECEYEYEGVNEYNTYNYIYNYDPPRYEKLASLIDQIKGKSFKEAIEAFGYRQSKEGYTFNKNMISSGRFENEPVVNNQYTFNLDLNDQKKEMIGNCEIITTSNYEEDYLVIRDYQASFDNQTEYSNISSNIGNVILSRDLEDPSIVYFKFERNMENEEKVELSFDFTLKFENEAEEYGYNKENNTYSLGYCLPILSVYEDGQFINHPMISLGECGYSESSNYTVNILVPEGYDVAGTGEKSNEGSHYTFEAKGVRDVVYMISNQFKTSEEIVGSTKVLSYAFDQKTADKMLTGTKESLIELNNKLIEYPYQTISVVEWNFSNGAKGKEYPQLIQINNCENCSEVILHEMSHQYFYNIVGNDQYEEPWLDEALASYITGERDECIKYVITQSYDYYFDQQNVNSHYEGRDGSFYYSIAVYDTGDMMFNELETYYGKEKIYSLLKTYLLTFAYDNAHSEDLVYLFKEILGEDSYEHIYLYVEDDILNQIY